MSLNIEDERVVKLIKSFRAKKVTQEDAENITRFHIESSRKSNTLWNLITDDFQSLYTDYLARIKLAIDDGLSYMFIDQRTQEIAYAFIQIDAYTFLESKLDKIPLPRTSNMLKFQANLTDKMELKEIKPEEITQRGSVICQLFVSINPSILASSWPSIISRMMDSHLKDLGYIMTVGRYTSNIISGFLAQDQGKILTEIKYQTQYGEQLPVIWYIRKFLKDVPSLQDLLIQSSKEILLLNQKILLQTTNEILQPKL